jgi:hypothetical protein
VMWVGESFKKADRFKFIALISPKGILTAQRGCRF